MKKDIKNSQEELALHQVIKQYVSFYESNMWNSWAKGYKDYLLDGSERSFRIKDFQSNLKVPLIKQYVDALWVSIYDNSLNFKTSGRNKTSLSKANAAHDYLSWAFNRSEAWEKIMDAGKECVIEGNGYLKVGFCNEITNRSYDKFVTKDGKIKKEKLEWVESNKHPTLNYVSIFNLFHPLYIKKLEDSPVVIERSIIHSSEVLKRFGKLNGFRKKDYEESLINPHYLYNVDFDKIKLASFWNRSKMKSSIEKTCKENGTSIAKLTSQGMFDIIKQNYLHIKYDGGYCEVFEYWEGETLKILVNGKLVYDGVNPLPDKKHPYIGLIFNKIPGLATGRGIALSLSDIQDIADEMMNLAIDNQKFLVTPIFEKIKGGDIFGESDGTIEWIPFKVIETNQKGAISRLDVGNPQMAGLSGGIEFLFQISEMSEGINSYSIGYQNKVERSATGVSALVQSFKARLLPLIDSLNQCLNVMAKKMLLYGIVYYDNEIEIDKVGDGGKTILKTISITDLIGEYNIEFNAQSLKTATREIKRESLLNLLNVVLPFAQMLKEQNNTNFKADEFLKDVFDTYELSSDGYFTSSDSQFIREEVNREKIKHKITKRIQEGVLTEEEISPKSPSEIFAGNAAQEQIAQESAEAKEGTENLPSTPGIDETVVSPLSELYK